MKKAILFTNYSDEDFTHNWDSVAYEFKAGQQMMLEASLCKHFARHLAIRELNKANKLTSKGNINTEMAKSISETNAIEAEDETKLKVKTDNVKVKKEVVKKDDLKEFEGK